MTVSQKSGSHDVLPIPPQFADGRWQQKVEIAKQAREDRRRQRAGLPAAFGVQWARTLTRRIGRTRP